MYCVKCKYTSFDHLDNCPKCGNEWMETKKVMNVDWLPPPTDTNSTQQTETSEKGDQESEGEEIELESDRFLLGSASQSEVSEQEKTRQESTPGETNIEEIEYPEIDFEESNEDLQLNDSNLELDQEPGENILSREDSAEAGFYDDEITEENQELDEQSSDDISHPDLEQLLDSYTMEDTQETDNSGQEPLNASTDDLNDEFELFGDLEADENKEDSSQEGIVNEGDDSSEVDGDTTSNSQKKSKSQKQEDEIDITSILDNSEDEDTDKNK